MGVISLSTHSFRNLKNTSLEFDTNNNYFVGDNGSGKSSLLESIFFIAHGKSFRTTKLEHITHYDKSNVVVSVLDDLNNRLGLSRDIETNLTTIKLNGKKLTKLSELAKNIAVQIITPESFKLFFGGAKERRRFVDLGLFHVKHIFSEQWRNFSRVQKQRNASLKNGNRDGTLQYWTEQFCSYSEELSELRVDYLNLLRDELIVWLDYLMPDIQPKVDISYLRGWSQKKDLITVLAENNEKEISYGYSLFGAHKFDVRFLINKKPVELALSRGQQKLFLLALTFAQSKLIEKVNLLKPILLIDDVGAELDAEARSRLNEAIKQLDCQVFITAIDEFALEPLIPKNENYKMFHVKHGEISEITK